MSVSRKIKISLSIRSLIFSVNHGPICPPMITPGTAQTKAVRSADAPNIAWMTEPAIQVPKMVTMLVATATRKRTFNRLRMRGTSHSPMLTLSMPLPTAMSETSHPQRRACFTATRS